MDTHKVGLTWTMLSLRNIQCGRRHRDECGRHWSFYDPFHCICLFIICNSVPMFLSLFLAHLVAEVILFIYLFLFECRCVIVRRLLFLFKFGCDEDI